MTDVVDKNADTTRPPKPRPSTRRTGKYAKFYAEFGAVLKEGLGEDFGNRERIAKLLRFASSTSDTRERRASPTTRRA